MTTVHAHDVTYHWSRRWLWNRSVISRRPVACTLETATWAYLYHSAITNSLLFWLRNLQWCRRVGEDSSMWQRGLGLVAGVAVSSTQLLKQWRNHAATSCWCEAMQWRAFNSSTTTPRDKKKHAAPFLLHKTLGSFDRFSKFFHCWTQQEICSKPVVMFPIAP